MRDQLAEPQRVMNRATNLSGTSVADGISLEIGALVLLSCDALRALIMGRTTIRDVLLCASAFSVVISSVLVVWL